MLLGGRRHGPESARVVARQAEPAATITAASAASVTNSQAKSPVRSWTTATSGTPSAATPRESTNFAPKAVARHLPGV
jgi:hypothetical protein